ncbi:hypothetical protein L7F22_026052 [Adiantum nelumboides]|nr:hypothetical protein [Adiantum nelumboides]
MIASILKWIKTYEGGERVSNEKFATYPRVVNQEGQPENLNFFLVALEEEDCCGALFTRVFDEVLASQIENDISRVVSCYIKLVKPLAANQLCLSGIVSNIRSWLAIYAARLPRIQGCLFELLYQLLCAVDHDRALDEESWGFLVNQFVHPLADSLNCLDDAAHKEGLLSLLSLMGLILHKSTENTGFLTQASGVILSHEQLQNSIKSCLVNFGAQGCKLSDLVGESSDGKILACVLAFQFICLRCAIDTLRPICHTTGLTHASVLSLKEDSLLIIDTCYDLVLPRSIEQVGKERTTDCVHLCSRIISSVTTRADGVSAACSVVVAVVDAGAPSTVVLSAPTAAAASAPVPLVVMAAAVPSAKGGVAARGLVVMTTTASTTSSVTASATEITLVGFVAASK